MTRTRVVYTLNIHTYIRIQEYTNFITSALLDLNYLIVMVMITGEKKRKRGYHGAGTINMEQEKKKEDDKYKSNTSRKTQTQKHGYFITMKLEDVGEVQMDNV